MTVTWALIADRSLARIYEQRGAGKELTLVEEIQHPEGHFQDRDINSDKMGRSFDKGGEGRHAMEPRELPHERISATFARFLAGKVREGRTGNRFDQLVLAAEPSFLGLLRDALDAPTRKLVSAEISKHLLGEGDGGIQKHLSAVLRIPSA